MRYTIEIELDDRASEKGEGVNKTSLYCTETKRANEGRPDRRWSWWQCLSAATRSDAYAQAAIGRKKASESLPRLSGSISGASGAYEVIGQ